MTNQLAETEPPSRTLIYNFGVSSVLLLPVVFLQWQPLQGREWLLLVGVGMFYALTQWLIILAYRYASASELSPFNYSVVVFSGLLGWIFFGNLPAASAIVGTLLICCGGILSIMSGHKEGLGHWFGTGHWHWPWKHRHPRRRRWRRELELHSAEAQGLLACGSQFRHFVTERHELHRDQAIVL